MKILRVFFLSLLLFLTASLFVGFGYYFSVTKDVSLSSEKLLLNDKTLVVYDKNLDHVDLSQQKLKQTTPVGDLHEYTKKAFIDVEDKRFFSHHGFDYKRVARAFLNNLKARSFKEGASTISQQLVKNTHLTQEKTLKRKLQEWKLTSALEKKYTKTEILEKYLNTIYFGHGCFGITSASEFYFGKTPDLLTLDESAILAGLVRSPNNYSPFKNPDLCSRRKASVLAIMQKNGTITEKEKNEALNAPLPMPCTKNSQDGYLKFVFDELSTLSEKHGFTVGGKTEIFTSLDPVLQAKTEKLAKENTEYDKTILVLDQSTHGFKCAYSTVGNIQRLPGSLIKPLLVYAPAIEEDLLSPATPILDEPIDYNGYAPKNFDGRSYGYVSVRECVEKSLNVPAVKILESIGIDKASEYMHRLSLPVDGDDKSLALALGGMKKGYTLKELTSAYSCFPSGGTFADCGFITKLNVNGETVYNRNTTTKRVFSEESAYLMTDMLKSTVKNGTAKKLRSLPFEIAAKTGTVGTQNGNTDAYALSYTTRDCVAVWTGNADYSKIAHTGSGIPCELSLKIHELLHEGYSRRKETISPFSRPKGISLVELDSTSYNEAHTLLRADENSPMEYRFSELFKASQIPVKQSDSFSSPRILSPSLSLTENGVTITLDPRSPKYYRYTVERDDGDTRTVVYDGDFIEFIVDQHIESGKVYRYAVTPKFNENTGETILLPSITTKESELPFNGEILSKNWWEY